MQKRCLLLLSLPCFLLAAGCDRLDSVRERFAGSSETADGRSEALQRAIDLHESGQRQAALQALEALVAQDATSSEAFYYLGLSYLMAAGDVEAESELGPEEEKSLAAFARALTLNPRHVPSQIGIGDLYFRRVPRGYKPPRSTGEEPVEKSPFQLAQEAYENAVAIDPASPQAQAHHADFLEHVGRYEDAESAHEAATRAAAPVPEIAPDYYSAFGRFLADRPNREDEAIAQYELALMFRQDDADLKREVALLRSRLGHAYLEKKQFALAEQELARAFEMFPDKSEPNAVKVSESLAGLIELRKR